MDTRIEELKQDLARAKYATRTREDYRRTAEDLSRHAERPIDEIERDQIRAYVEHVTERSRSASWLKMKLAAVVFLFARTLGRPADVSFIKFPRQHSPLPTVLSQGEVQAFLQAVQHSTYRAIALVLYGTGLRLDEALSLEVKDIDGREAWCVCVTARGIDRAR